MIAKHVLDTPSTATRSVRDLARYLTAPARDEIQKAWHVYTWLAQFVSYDVEALQSGRYPDVSPEGVLHHRKTVCAGYANLFQALTRAADLESEVVSGYAKSCGFLEDNALDGPANHAWNAVKINGKWELVDSTWGAGYVDEKHQFVCSLREFFFMTPANELIYSHFPEESRWQLLNPPIRKSRFASTVSLPAAFFNYKLRLGSHSQATIRVKNETHIVIFAPEDVQLLLKFENAGTEVSSAHVEIRHEQPQCRHLHVRPPHPGEYHLLLFVKRPSDVTPYYHFALDYAIHAI